MIQQNVQQAQGQLNELKNKLASLGTGSYGNSSGEIDMPEGTRLNHQKVKSLKDRIEIGANIQSQKSNRFFPQTNDLGLSVSFKMSDKFSAGVGSSVKIGLGNWNAIRVSYEGIGIRSHISWLLHGSFYLSGGYEQNYRTAFRNLQQLRNYNAWQSSALVGVSKRYSVGGKKLKGEMKLLLDCLSFSQIPKGQPVIFRIGYALK